LAIPLLLDADPSFVDDAERTARLRELGAMDGESHNDRSSSP
jgi:hypothetical protein